MTTRTVRFSVFSSAKDNQPKVQELPLVSFIQSLTGDPELSDQKEAGEAWSPAFYPEGSSRKKDAVEGLSCIGLDFDRGRDGELGLTDEDSEDLFAWLGDEKLLFASHNSFSSGAVYPREKLRVVLFFDRPVSPSEYGQVWKGLYESLPVKPDKACSDVSRIYFSPRVPEKHLKYYQANTDGDKLLEVGKYLTKKSLGLNEAREQRDWRKELKTTKEKHNTLVRAAYWLGTEGFRHGYSSDDTVKWAWAEAITCLEANPDPVKDWAAAEKTCKGQAVIGWSKAQDEAALTVEAVEAFKVTEKMAAAGLAALKKDLKLVESDYGQLSNASYRLGRYTPHVLATEHVKKELFKAATQVARAGAEGFLTATEANATIDGGVARGQKNPLYVYPGWKSQLVIDPEKGTLLVCDENAVLIFAQHPECAGLLRWNVRKGKPFFCYAPPWPTEKTEFPSPIADEDAAAAGRWLARQMGRPLASMERTLGAMNAVARLNSWDPFLEWLEGLRWDGKPRLDSWLHVVCGVEDNPYHRLVGSKWVLSAVARTLTPGCDAQHVLVLVGKQGIGKSRAFRELCGHEYFCSNIGDINKEDAIFNLEKYVLVELAELAAFRRAEMEVIKRFISDSSEDLRRKYARNSQEIVRRAIFGGSTNVKEFLSDPSGNRRFWPVLCKQEIRLTWLVEHREQLWAEARERVRRGEEWWPVGEEQLLCQDGLDEYVDKDDLLSELEFFKKEFKQWPLHVQGETTLADGQLDPQTRKFLWVTVKQAHLLVGTEVTCRADQLRVTKMCLQLGWEKTNKVINGQNLKIWRL